MVARREDLVTELGTQLGRAGGVAVSKTARDRRGRVEQRLEGERGEAGPLARAGREAAALCAAIEDQPAGAKRLGEDVRAADGERGVRDFEDFPLPAVLISELEHVRKNVGSRGKS